MFFKLISNLIKNQIDFSVSYSRNLQGDVYGSVVTITPDKHVSLQSIDELLLQCAIVVIQDDKTIKVYFA